MGNAPDYLIQQLQYVGDSQPYNLPNNNEFQLQRSDTNARLKRDGCNKKYK